VASAQDWAKAQTVGGSGANQHKSKPATLPDSPVKLDTVADRAAQSGASERTQRMADKVAKESPDLAKKVAHGEVSLPAAVKEDLSTMDGSTSEFGGKIREHSRIFESLPEPSVWNMA